MSERGSDTNRDPQRWMHSMHVDAFFEYLLENPHPYWTEIPLDPNPIREGGRDGVAAEDDMALRSLLPHIRPRRGRKRPDDESSSRSPSQKPKMQPGSNQNNPNATASGVDQQQIDLWAAVQPDARSGTDLFARDHFTRMNMNLAPQGQRAGEEFVQTPITAQSYTSMTPAAGAAYWPEHPGETKTSTTPTKAKINKRHGAKVVSSAWRSGGPGGSGKIRGRPPLNRQTSQTHSQGEAATAASASSFSSFPSTQSASPPAAFMHSSIQQSPHMMNASLQQHSMMTPGMHNPSATLNSTQHLQQGIGGTQHFYNMTGQSSAPTTSRNLRHTKSRLSLQVPERRGAEVRLATPLGQQHVPAMMVNGAMSSAGDQASIMANLSHHQSLNTTSMGDADVHLMDPFGASAATQDMYNMLYQQQQVSQHQHQHAQQHVQQVPQGSQNAAPFFSTTMTPTQYIAAAAAAHQHPVSPPPTTLFHHPTPVSLPESTGADARSVLPTHSHDNADNRTNLDALEALLTYELLGAEWLDVQGGQTATPCSVEEAGAVAREIVENARRTAGSSQGFLMNIAAIAGVTWLKKTDERVRVQNMGPAEGGKGEIYDLHWELQLGDVKSGFSLREVVNKEDWVKRKEHQKEHVESADVKRQRQQHEEDEEEGKEANENAAPWRSKYQGLLGVVQEQNAELSGLRQSMIDLCRPQKDKEDRRKR